jgi:hypothetical protein
MWLVYLLVIMLACFGVGWVFNTIMVEPPEPIIVNKIKEEIINKIATTTQYATTTEYFPIYLETECPPCGGCEEALNELEEEYKRQLNELSHTLEEQLKLCK